MLEYGFREGIDFYQTDKKVRLVQGGYNSVLDWVLTLDTAKEIAMVQRTPSGKAIRDYLLKLHKDVESGHRLDIEQVRALIDLIQLCGLASIRKEWERRHFEQWGKPSAWWQHRAQLLGYSVANLKAACRKAGIRYKSQQQALMQLDKAELVRATVVDIYSALGHADAYAQNMGNHAKTLYPSVLPLFDNDTDGGFSWLTPQQKSALAHFADTTKALPYRNNNSE